MGRTPLPPEKLLLLRTCYETSTKTLREIAAEAGCSVTSVSRLALLHGWLRHPEAQPPALQAGAATRQALLLERLWRASERQVFEIEKRLADGSIDPALRERDARVVAIIVKTLKELQALREETGRQEMGRQEAADGSSTDPFPRDLDAFRDEVARHIDRLRQAADAAGGAGRPAGGDA